MTGIVFIGFGEAAGAVVEGWGSGDGIGAFDVLTERPETADKKWADYARAGVTGFAGRALALAEAGFVFSTVTADRAVAAASECAPHLQPGALWFDMNSCAPSSKRKASEIVEAAGGRYVDVAVMAPVCPKRHEVPLLVAGPHAGPASEALLALGLKPRIVDGATGAASTIKMLRSIMVKGMEALTAECALAAVRAGVDGEVLGSLDKSFPGFDWSRQTAYNFERMLMHGRRRAAEMREVAKTVEDLGFPADMSQATAVWQERIGTLDTASAEDMGTAGHAALAKMIAERLALE
jgi:3-hydroxyisobutyrate dehydrogenase-like beta-hydroxyacid dehydrogenase